MSEVFVDLLTHAHKRTWLDDVANYKWSKRLKQTKTS